MRYSPNIDMADTNMKSGAAESDYITYKAPVSYTSSLESIALPNRRTALASIAALIGLGISNSLQAEPQNKILTNGEKKLLKPTPLEIQAVALSKQMMTLIKNCRLRLGHTIDEVRDPYGLIGPEKSSIVTLEGKWHAKRFATEPKWAAAMVKILQNAGVGQGTIVAVGMTGSLPGLNINLMSALKVLGAAPIIISSAGASGYGATAEDYPWPAMEADLAKNGMGFRSLACSIGGPHDTGIGKKVKIDVELLAGYIERASNRLVTIDEIDSKRQRMKMFFGVEHVELINTNAARSDRQPSIYINVGGGSVSLTILKELKDKGFPVINFRNASDLFDGNGDNDVAGAPIIPEPYLTSLGSSLKKIKRQELLISAVAQR